MIPTNETAVLYGFILKLSISIYRFYFHHPPFFLNILSTSAFTPPIFLCDKFYRPVIVLYDKMKGSGGHVNCV